MRLFASLSRFAPVLLLCFASWGEVRAELEETPQQQAERSCPRAFVGSLETHPWRGEGAGQTSFALERVDPAEPIPVFRGLRWLSANAKHLRKGLAVDAETTGLVGPIRAFEIAIYPFTYDVRTSEIVTYDAPYVGLEDPGFRLSPEVVSVTGITNEELHGQKFDRRLLRKLFEEADFVVAHNAAYDRPIFDALIPASRKKYWGCSMKGVDWYARHFPSRSLEALAIRHGNFDVNHRAIGDARLLLRLLAMADRDSGRSYLHFVRRAAARNEIEFQVDAPFPYRRILRQMGFEWDGLLRRNVRSVRAEEANALRRELRRAGLSAMTREIEITAKNRYTADLPTGSNAAELLVSDVPFRRTEANGFSQAEEVRLRRLPPLQADASHRPHTGLLVHAVPTGRDADFDSLVELVVVPVFVDAATGELRVSEAPYHGFQAAKEPLSQKFIDRFGFTDGSLQGWKIDWGAVAPWFESAQFVLAFDPAGERLWVDATVPRSRKLPWISVRDDVDWMARVGSKTSFEPLFARHGFFVPGPDASMVAAGLVEVLNAGDTEGRRGIDEAFESAFLPRTRVFTRRNPSTISDTMRQLGFRFLQTDKVWARDVLTDDAPTLEAATREALDRIGAQPTSVLSRPLSPLERFR